MASFLETIKVLVELDSSKASGAFKGLQSDVAKVDDSFKKVKTSGGGIFDAIKANAGVALAGAGAAVGAFAVKAASQFEDLALSVDSFRQKTGTSADAASRWVEVGNDLGVSADAIATAFGKMERADAAGTLNQFGLTATTASGKMAELLEKIGKIPDEGERATAAFKVFGRSWQELAPLIDSTEQLSKRLEEVPKGKLISNEDIKAAREFRDNMDDLRDAIEGLVNEIGGRLVKAVNEVVEAARKIGGPIADLVAKGQDVADSASGWFDVAGAVDIMTTAFNYAYNPITQMGGAIDAVTTGFGLWGDSGDDAAKSTDAVSAAAFRMVEGFNAGTVAADNAAESEKAMSEAAATLNKNLEEQAKQLQAAAKAQNDQVDAQRAAGDAYIAVGKATDDYNTFLGELDKNTKEAKGNQEKLNEINRDAVQKTADLADAQVTLAQKEAESNAQTQTATQKFDLWGHSMLESAANLSGPVQGAVLNYIAKVNDIPPEKLTEIQALIAQGKLEEAKTALDNASAARTAAVIADADTATAEAELNHVARDRQAKVFLKTVGPNGEVAGGYARGGYVSADLVLVGEQGPELVSLPSGSYVHTAAESRMMAHLMGVQQLQSGGYVPDQTYTSGWPFPTTERVQYGKTYQSSINALNFGPSFMDAEGNTVWSVPVAAPQLPVAPRNDLASRGTVINVYMPPGSDGQDVVDALKQYERRNGFVPIKTTSDFHTFA